MNRRRLYTGKQNRYHNKIKNKTLGLTTAEKITIKERKAQYLLPFVCETEIHFVFSLRGDISRNISLDFLSRKRNTSARRIFLVTYF